MGPLPARTLLEAWERGRSRHPVDRALILHALAAPAADPDGLADEPLGRRNAALLALRAASFGPRLRARVDCPACAEPLELEVDANELLAERPEPAASVEVDGLRFRPPSSRDLARIAGERDGDAATRRLLSLCLLDPEEAAVVPDLRPLLDRVEGALEKADPWSDPRLELGCEACGHAWSIPLDVAAYLWDEVEVRAQGLLDEVHLLARAYGWSEGEILSLSEERRGAYLERVTA